MLDTRQMRVLIALPYDRLVDSVVELLEARCKGEMVGGGQTPMYDITYAFHISRCEYGRGEEKLGNTSRMNFQIFLFELPN